MTENIAVAIVHGTGSKEPDFADDIMDQLQRCFPRHLPEAARQRAGIIMEPVYWADKTREKENEIWERVLQAGRLDFQGLRRFLFNVCGDTLAYQPSEGRLELYQAVHRVMAEAFQRLAERAGEDAPLCVVAHSMGTVVVHNYLYDIQNHTPFTEGLPRPETPLERSDTLALLCTYGSPLALWRLRFGEDYQAIRFPGESVEARYPGLKPRWLNIYDVDDVLGYPLSTVTEHYEEMARQGYLQDCPQEVGGYFSGFYSAIFGLLGNTPIAHKGYFRDSRSLNRMAGYIAETWQGCYDNR